MDTDSKIDGKLNLSILTPERRLIESVLVETVSLPGSEGEIQLLPGHAPMIGTLQSGTFSYRIEGKDDVVGVISSGFFEIQDDQIFVMAETLELQSEISLERARKAQKAAEESLNEASLDDHQFKKYQLKLERSLIRQQLANSKSKSN